MEKTRFYHASIEFRRFIRLFLLLVNLFFLSCRNEKKDAEYDYYMENIVSWDLKLDHLILHIDLPIELEKSNYQRFSFTNRNNYTMSYPDYYFSVDEVSDEKLRQYLEVSDFPINFLAERFLGDTLNIPAAFNLLMYADAKRIQEYDYLYQSEVEKMSLPKGKDIFVRSMEFNNIGANHFYIYSTFSHRNHHYLLQCIFAIENANYFYADWIKILNNLSISEV